MNDHTDDCEKVSRSTFVDCTCGGVSPMNAADVLAEELYGRYVPTDSPSAIGNCSSLVAALLAHGKQGQGVTIEADGDLHPKDPPMTTRDEDGTLWALSAVVDRRGVAYRLVPLSAEAGDTDG